MYSNKENINILTSLLLEYGVSDAVVCPGSRNAPIVHNLSQCSQMHCHPVTDERSAGFFALGLALATHRPVVVCVTSGTALLNLAPAVAEASCQHVPLVVVSADRPPQWIGQLDGQTLPQPDALGRFVRKAVTLPEPRDDEERWYCRRLVNEALHAASFRQPSPVHINVPITEPLFTFDVERLPEERRFSVVERACCGSVPCGLSARLRRAARPLIVFGQMACGTVPPATLHALMRRYVVFGEPLSNPSYTTVHFDEAVRFLMAQPADASAAGQPLADAPQAYTPDYIIYIGDTLVSKPARRWLRASKAPSCLVTPDGLDVHDPVMTLEDIVECPSDGIGALLDSLCAADGVPDGSGEESADALHAESQREFYDRWQSLLLRMSECAEAYQPAYSQMAAVKYFEEQLDDLDTDICVHYANSTAIRLACIYSAHYVWCNRGVNGIEGSLSAAAGFAAGTESMTVCVIGDLSFFYDQNALWNKNLRGNLRIILLNNRGGGIFRQLKGLGDSPAAAPFVEAEHETTAQGICTQNDIGYLSAKDMSEMQIGIVTLLTRETERPMLLEVFTDKEEDARTLGEYFRTLR